MIIRIEMVRGIKGDARSDCIIYPDVDYVSFYRDEAITIAKMQIRNDPVVCPVVGWAFVMTDEGKIIHEFDGYWSGQ